MRGLLRVLRESDADAERRPQPGLGDIADLVGQANDAGMAVTLGQPEGPWTVGVGQLTGLTAYRIVQEATSNALRHAPGSAVDVVLRRVGDDIEVTVTNACSAEPDTGVSRPGHGLMGMSERAASVGGTVRFGPTDDGGFSVQARLPVFPKVAR
jgi:signal transduction histidine kinase